jgi:hypothetical protein
LEVEQVRTLLRNFQEGYTRRDPAHLDAFMELFTEGSDLEIIGTNAVEPGADEWCLGREAARRLVAGDWEHWGDVVYDVEGARIFVRGDVAWLATAGTVNDTIPLEDRYTGYLAYVRSVLEDSDHDTRGKMLDIVGLGNDILIGLPLSETFTWPFRFTALAVREHGDWRFHQMQFSFATTRAPDVRT